MDHSAADMTDAEVRSFGRALRIALARLRVVPVVRSVVAVVTLLLVLVTLDPFPDLRNPDLANAASGRLLEYYVAFAGLAAVAVLLTVSDDGPSLRTLWTPLHLCFLGWMLVNIAFSESREISLQRFVLTASVTVLAVLLPLLPPTRTSFNLCFGGAALALLALCYLGILLAPQLATHTAADIAEPNLAGDWRGTFGHKNVASPVMSVLVYLGIYLTSAGSFIMGPMIALLAGVFLVFTGGKTSTVLCLIIYGLASLVYVTRSLWLKRMICFVPLIVMNLLTVGSAVSPSLAAITSRLVADPSFTGRTDIWQFALSAVAEKPFLGHGYAAFWDAAADRQTARGAEWAVTAAHSHNSYLDLAVTIGLPGLLLCILMFVAAPLGDFHVAQDKSQSRPLAKLFLTIWLFGLYYGTTETFLLDRLNPTWFMFALAVAGLHFLSRFQCVDAVES